jgi:hypothetical protein
MAIVINKKDSLASIQRKLEKADVKMKALVKAEIQSLCGILKEKGDPVQIIRKMRDEEWG